MDWKKSFTIATTLFTLISQGMTSITASAVTDASDDSVTNEIYFEQNDQLMTNLSLEQNTTQKITVVDKNDEDATLIIDLPAAIQLDADATNKQLADAQSVNYNQENNRVTINFKMDKMESKKANLVLKGVNPTQNTAQAFFAKTQRSNGKTYQSKAVMVSVSTPNTTSSDTKSTTNSTNDVSSTEDAGESDSSRSKVDASVRSGNANVDLDISAISDTILSGADATYALNFKVTGSQTIYNHAAITVNIPTGYSLNQELSSIQIAGVTPTFNETTGQLLYSFDQITSGQAYTVNLKVATKNGTTPKGTAITLTSDFTADEFSGNAHTEATEVVDASSSLASSKKYAKTLDTNNAEKTDPPTAGDTGVWSIKISADKKDTGLLYFKEGSKIKIVDTIPDGLTYVNDNASGVYDASAKTVTWEFDAPTTAEQEAATDSLFNKEIELNLKFNDDIANFAKFTNNVHSEGTDISDQTVVSDASADISAGISDPNNIPPGTQYWPNHGGPIDGQGSTGPTFNSNNPDPVVYDSALLGFSIDALAGPTDSPTKDFEKYTITYDVDGNLNLAYLDFSGWANFRPDTSYPDGVSLSSAPRIDIYVTVNGEERKAISDTEFTGKSFTLQDLGLSSSDHVSQFRFDFTNAPAGLYTPFMYPRFTIKKGFTGTVTNKVHYDVTGYNKAGEKVSWNNNSEADTINSLTGPRTAEVVAPPADSIPIARSAIAFDNSDNGVVKAGDNRITGSFANDKSSPEEMNQPLESMVLLPVGVVVNEANPEYQLMSLSGKWDEATSDGNNQNGNVAIVNNDYNGTGRQLIKVQWNDAILNPGRLLSYSFNVVIQESAPTPLRMDTHGFSGEEKLAVPSGAATLTDSYLEIDTADLNGDGNTTQNSVLSSNQYRMIKENQVKTEKLVKGDKDDTYSKFAHTSLGGAIDYQLTMTNEGSNIGNFVMMDVLSSEGDLGITDNTSRGSKFTPELTGAITLPSEWNGKVTIKYSEATNPSRKTLDDNVNYPETTEHLTDPADAQEPNWVTADQVSDWSKIHSFIVTLDDGAWTTGETITLSFSMKAPSELPSDLTNPDNDDQTRAAWNSFAYTANNSQVVEPERVGVVVDFVGSAVLTKTDSVSGDALQGAVFELQDKDGKVLQSDLATDESGKLTVNNLAPGDYQFVETEAPTGYDLDTTPVTFTIDSGQTEAVQVSMTNTLTPGGVVLTKTDSVSRAVLQGAVFELQDKDGKVLQSGLTTDESGKLAVDDLTPGDYQFVETQAPTGYDLDATPVTFKIEKGQTEAVQVSLENTLTPGGVVLTKVDDQTGAKLAGAIFELQDKNGKVLQSGLTTDASGKLAVDGLAPGAYQFVETQAPAGYELDKTPVTFTIEKGQTVAKEVEKTNTEKDHGVVLRKVDAETLKGLQGAVFELRNSEGKVLKKDLTTDKLGYIYLEELKAGNYQLVEIQAPTGYILDSTPLNFTVEKEQAGIISLVKKNQKKTTPDGPNNSDGKSSNTYRLPQTGEANSAILLSLGGMLIVLFLGVWFLRKKRIN